ncbi:MAG: hypothetical protein IPO45_08055 [Saprospiraceae bacterium]|jgi:hypothetical protein|uniref:hypothetical protein n=1 Tax=Candidatus Brachybacter algidus TaxID=2982024 RepID=UPI001B3EFD11|nr:hypothetical protein [Candidatus Brachybacter algidus]MBP7306428.1 hypothetical protein [Saprospiraceae bacterium]MBK6373420.1 hypothetical protein [Candidatus Brachybacter algidus]MBK7602882.1 hypothetical protein [Candidatus Brachybacter algidus]MBK8602088.1 hypothetical protein [Candidatus Brachybacter algidus]MBK8842960.1 hypothetical protein [Candidatus Brachybacter algidus]
MKGLNEEAHSAKIIKMNEDLKVEELSMLLIEKENIDKLLNSLVEIDIEITNHLKNLNDTNDKT